MKDIILEKITNGISLSSLAQITNLSEKRLGYIIHMLRNEGYNIRETYDFKGNIYYYLGYNLGENGIIIDSNSKDLRALIISDVHIGKTEDGINNLYKVMEYAKNNDIHIIFNLGDLFDGFNDNVEANPEVMEYQVDRFFKNYPYSDNIIHFILLGNHDYSIYKRLGFDLSKKIISRPDIVCLGYGANFIKIGSDIIGFKHELLDTKPLITIPEETKFIFRGHSHKYEHIDITTYVPALLQDNFYPNLLSCGFLDVTFMLDENSNIDTLITKYLALLNQPREVSEIYVSPKVKKKI